MLKPEQLAELAEHFHGGAPFVILVGARRIIGYAVTDEQWKACKKLLGPPDPDAHIRR